MLRPSANSAGAMGLPTACPNWARLCVGTQECARMVCLGLTNGLARRQGELAKIRDWRSNLGPAVARVRKKSCALPQFPLRLCTAALYKRATFAYMTRQARLPQILITCAFAASALVLSRPAALGAEAGNRIVGIESCATSGCHGGGAGKNQVQIHRKDQHANATLAMVQAPWSTQLTQNLGISSPYTNARCTVCHTPFRTVAQDKFMPDLNAAKAGDGVSCESCHGPAEYWLRSHTRPDYTHAMRVSIGMREMKDLYNRANACVGCHQNIDPDIVANGHVPLTFELDDFDTRETAHWKDKGAWLGPKRWLTGQAVALRELSWSLANQHANPGASRGVKVMQDHWAAVSWVLRKTEAGRNLPAGSDYVASQAASDRIARAAANQDWSKESTMKLMRTLVGTRQEFGRGNAETSPASAQRGFLLAASLRRLYLALRNDGGMAQNTNIEKSLDALFEFTKDETNFDGEGYGRMLEQIDIELAKG